MVKTRPFTYQAIAWPFARSAIASFNICMVYYSRLVLEYLYNKQTNKQSNDLQVKGQEFVTQRQLMRLFAVKLILSYEQKFKGQNFSKVKACLRTNLDINSMCS